MRVHVVKEDDPISAIEVERHIKGEGRDVAVHQDRGHALLGKRPKNSAGLLPKPPCEPYTNSPTLMPRASSRT